MCTIFRGIIIKLFIIIKITYISGFVLSKHVIRATSSVDFRNSSVDFQLGNRVPIKSQLDSRCTGLKLPPFSTVVVINGTRPTRNGLIPSRAARIATHLISKHNRPLIFNHLSYLMVFEVRAAQFACKTAKSCQSSAKQSIDIHGANERRGDDRTSARDIHL